MFKNKNTALAIGKKNLKEYINLKLDEIINPEKSCKVKHLERHIITFMCLWICAQNVTKIMI